MAFDVSRIPGRDGIVDGLVGGPDSDRNCAAGILAKNSGALRADVTMRLAARSRPGSSVGRAQP